MRGAETSVVMFSLSRCLSQLWLSKGELRPRPPWTPQQPSPLRSRRLHLGLSNKAQPQWLRQQGLHALGLARPLSRPAPYSMATSRLWDFSRGSLGL